ncbi:hypothetical protein [Arenibacter palladensis]|uniref:hypothetical protein n=1 Tax=Arenibacter palladensis TaxID=237373 RepID=UPI0026E2AE36|nr:hypothetical protein [Arenibacter palladensis]MDO6602112.1 hypothetical protein [Arenibacter palladensis]
MPIITILISLIIAFLFYFKVKKKVNKWGILTNYISTILSIVIGAMISILIFNYQESKTDERELTELKINLEAELSDIQRVLSSGDVLTINKLPFLITYVEPIIIGECAKSGLFNSKDVENLLHLSRKIKFYNVQVEYLLNIIQKEEIPSFSILLKNCNRNMETSRSQILKNILQTASQLDMKLSETRNK